MGLNACKRVQREASMSSIGIPGLAAGAARPVRSQVPSTSRRDQGGGQWCVMRLSPDDRGPLAAHGSAAARWCWDRTCLHRMRSDLAARARAAIAARVAIAAVAIAARTLGPALAIAIVVAVAPLALAIAIVVAVAPPWGA